MAKAGDKTILVVDDEPDVRNYLAMLLRDAGFKVVTAVDGQDALALIEENKPDFISLDLCMPRKSGHKLLSELKRNKEWSRIPVLVVTAHASDDLGKDDLEDLLKNRVLSGPGTYLEKPVDSSTYVRSIQRTLGVEPSEAEVEQTNLKEELRRSLSRASPEALRKALAALKKK